jgi:hypothetical protein
MRARWMWFIQSPILESREGRNVTWSMCWVVRHTEAEVSLMRAPCHAGKTSLRHAWRPENK